MSVIRTEGLTKFYGKARGIVDVDLSVEAGDFFGFIFYIPIARDNKRLTLSFDRYLRFKNYAFLSSLLICSLQSVILSCPNSSLR